MNGTDDLDQRIKDLVDQRVNEALSGRMKRRDRSHTFLGIVVIVAGLVWLGKSMDIYWLDHIKFWPMVVILFGIYLLVGDRE
jgi:hypothetical protein